MPPRVPSLDELARLADRHHLSLEPDDLREFQELMAGPLASYARLDEISEPEPEPAYPRSPGRRPEPAENPYGAWSWKTDIRGAATGPLAGRRVVIKDNVCVAGVPMMNGTRALEDYVPDVDATVVTRILDAGGEIVGKSVCECLCFSGGSHTAYTGPTRNPHDPSRSSGGSSSGSAVLVALGEADLAIGGDQGGSIRMPSSWTGICGHKPTWGLVPYTGVFPVEMTLDHVGPMARTVADLAVLLDVIAGPDGLDPRQQYDLRTAPYGAGLDHGVAGLRVGLVREGFDWPGLSEADVDAAVRAAAERFTELGATVREVSIPWHRDGVHLCLAIVMEGGESVMLGQHAMGSNWKGRYLPGLAEAFGQGVRKHADDLSDTAKLLALTGTFMREEYHGSYYGRAQNLSRSLRAAYDAALADLDVLVMPTQPLKATEIPPADAPRGVQVARALEMIVNTCPMDVTGHPALSLPIGTSNGLPVGMMIVGRRWEDAEVLRAGHAWQTAFGADAAPLPPR
ncbi:amidase [Pseudonocardia sp. H11422]|uniref:amidase n=1 Tax=Pseudonocardia sp. H11422 TaxID=2835866 RepID=UPI001BDD1572|nr:amidase [Pseudonocardia sp. H11422]